VNSDTLGTLCSTRLGRADSDVPNRAVNTDYRARQAYYPWGTFSVVLGTY
jgi:hypothetical protein